jgi:hypothetical protein
MSLFDHSLRFLNLTKSDAYVRQLNKTDWLWSAKRGQTSGLDRTKLAETEEVSDESLD